jgi:hypothetical protein
VALDFDRNKRLAKDITETSNVIVDNAVISGRKRAGATGDGRRDKDLKSYGSTKCEFGERPIERGVNGVLREPWRSLSR